MAKPYTLDADDRFPVYFATKTVETPKFSIRAGERFPNQWQEKRSLRSLARIFGESDDPAIPFSELSYVRVVVPDDLTRLWAKDKR